MCTKTHRGTDKACKHINRYINTLHVTTLKYTTPPYYPTTRDETKQYSTMYYRILYNVTLQHMRYHIYITLHDTILHYTTLNHITLLCTSLHVHRTTSQSIVLGYAASHYAYYALHIIAVQYIMYRAVLSHCTTLHHIVLHYDT